MVRLLFVCLGNICRSPAAEAIMNHLISSENLVKQIECDSAGTAGYHAGEPADTRMIHHCRRRGYNVTSLARRVYPMQDFAQFDYILSMDKNVHRALEKMQDFPSELDGKLLQICAYANVRSEEEVPDPYYGGQEGFETVIDVLEDACRGLLQHIIKERNLK